MTATQQFIGTLQSLKPGDLGRLRKLAGLPLDESVAGFDLFAGLWWPLRDKTQRCAAPRSRLARCQTLCVLSHAPGRWHDTACAAPSGQTRRRTKAQCSQQMFDELLMLSLGQIEPALQWAIRYVADASVGLDWVRLTDDLSTWEREGTRLKWAKQYLQMAD